MLKVFDIMSNESALQAETHTQHFAQGVLKINCTVSMNFCRVVGWCEGAVYLTSLGGPTDIGLQLGKTCYPCSG